MKLIDCNLNKQYLCELMKNWLVFSCIVVVALYFSSCSSFTKLQKNGTYDEKYAGAMKYYEEEDYYKAGILFNDIRPYSSGKPNAEMIVLYSAYCEYYGGSPYMASFGFKKFYETYPRSERVEEAMFMYAEALYAVSPVASLDQEATYDAIDAYQYFLIRFPTTEYKEKCNRKVQELSDKLELKAYNNAKLQLKIRHYRAAVMAFDSFVLKYPTSKYIEELKFRKVEAQYYFAKMSLERVVKDGKTLYLQRDRYKDAVKYYKQFIDTYPNSSFANEAETIYSEIINKLKELT